MEIISPIESVSLFGSDSSLVACICSRPCGTLFMNLGSALRDDPAASDLGELRPFYQIKRRCRFATVSPNRQAVACVQAGHCAVYVYDLVAQSADVGEYVSVATGGDCCDAAVWADDSSVLLCYNRKETKHIYFVHPSTKASQKVALKQILDDDQILVGYV